MPELFCPTCVYSLRGNISNTCPECGEVVIEEALRRELAMREAEFRAIRKQWLIVTALVGGLFAAMSFFANRVPAFLFALLIIGACTHFLTSAEWATRLMRWVSYRNRVLDGRRDYSPAMGLAWLSTYLIMLFLACLGFLPGFIVILLRFT